MRSSGPGQGEGSPDGIIGVITITFPSLVDTGISCSRYSCIRFRSRIISASCSFVSGTCCCLRILVVSLTIATSNNLRIHTDEVDGMICCRSIEGDTSHVDDGNRPLGTQPPSPERVL